MAKRSQQSQLLQDTLKNVELAYQNLESVELGVTTVDHYFDTLGGIAAAVKRAKGGVETPSISEIKPAVARRYGPCVNRLRWKPAPAV